MTVWFFPGQGSQRRGMGAELFDRYPDETAEAGHAAGFDIRQFCLTSEPDTLRRTEFLQPALFLVNALTARQHAEKSGPPDYLAGHSLGELNALHAAGCFDLATGVRLVRRRGELMARAAGGGMLAVIGMPVARVAELLAEGAATGVDIANHNSATQVVLAGAPAELSRIAGLVSADGAARAVPLPVSAAFHSRHMTAAADEFAAVLRDVPLAAPRIPVLSNVTGLPYPADQVPDLLARQLCSPVRWHAGMRWLIARGQRDAVELGPGRVLTALWRETLAEQEKPAPVAPATPGGRLGHAGFKADFGIRYAYLAGSMFRGVSSVEMLTRLGRAGLMGFFGTGGLPLDTVEGALKRLGDELGPDGRFGMNLLYPYDDPALEQATVDLYLRRGVRFVEAAAYTSMTAPLVRLRFTGAHRDRSGRAVAGRRIVAKVSRPETAAAFLRPPAPAVLAHLVDTGGLTAEEARLAAELPVSEDICVEADSAGHTDGGVAFTLVPSIIRLRDEVVREYGLSRVPRVGTGGGIGAPEAVAAAFTLGADFVLTGSVNQCSPQAGVSDAVKDLLATVDVQDTTYAPAGDMFELGARVQVVRKGTMFAARGNKLWQLYQRYDSLDEIDPKTRRNLEESVFRRPLDEVWRQTEQYHRDRDGGEELARAERDPKRRMALVFRWYFAHSTRLALRGESAERVNFQVHCGPAMGAFNRFVRGTALEPWRERHVDAIADRLMEGAAAHLARCAELSSQDTAPSLA